MREACGGEGKISEADEMRTPRLARCGRKRVESVGVYDRVIKRKRGNERKG